MTGNNNGNNNENKDGDADADSKQHNATVNNDNAETHWEKRS